jgi:hypothetical protein
MSKMVYPVGGGLEDWGYGASWDTYSDDATLDSCKPKTYPLTGKLTEMSKDQQEKVVSLIYLVETFRLKQPPQWTLGGRYFENDTVKGIFDQSNDVKNNNEIINGHINRNIRMIYKLA